MAETGFLRALHRNARVYAAVPGQTVRLPRERGVPILQAIAARGRVWGCLKFLRTDRIPKRFVLRSFPLTPRFSGVAEGLHLDQPL